MVRRQCLPVVVTEVGQERATLSKLQASGTEVCARLWSYMHLPEERARRLADWVNLRRPDVFVVSVSPDAGWLALPLIDPSIATMAVAHTDEGSFYEPLKYYQEFVDCAVGVSETVRRNIIEYCGVSPQRAYRIPYGVTCESRENIAQRIDRTRAGTKLRIGYVGRLVQRQKRVLDLALLAGELSRRQVAFELVVIGDGEERGRLERELRRRTLEGCASVTGWLEVEEVRQRLGAVDVLVLMSEFEGLPIALLEGMGQGVVPVVSDIKSGNSEVVQSGTNGFLVPVGDVGGFADRIESLSRNPELLRRLKSAAWETGRKYSVGAMAESYIHSFTRLARIAKNRTVRESGAPVAVMPSCRSPYPRWLRKLKRRMGRMAMWHRWSANDANASTLGGL